MTKKTNICIEIETQSPYEVSRVFLSLVKAVNFIFQILKLIMIVTNKKF